MSKKQGVRKNSVLQWKVEAGKRLKILWQIYEKKGKTCGSGGGLSRGRGPGCPSAENIAEEGNDNMVLRLLWWKYRKKLV